MHYIISPEIRSPDGGKSTNATPQMQAAVNCPVDVILQMSVEIRVPCCLISARASSVRHTENDFEECREGFSVYKPGCGIILCHRFSELCPVRG